MGLASMIRKAKLKERQMRVLILGLDGAGKSTVVAQWTNGNVKDVSPTFGFKIHTKPFKDFQIHLWDIGGQKTIRPYWRNYFEETDGLVFVIDSAAPHRLGEALEELSQLLAQDRLMNASVLILANKQDCNGAVHFSKIEESLKLSGILGDSNRGKTHWSLLGCSAITGENIQDALEWLVSDISTRLYHIK